MSSPSAYLSIIASQFDGVVNRSEFITMATMQINENWFTDDKYNLAIAYMAAHLITINTDPSFLGSGGGAVISKKEGDLSIGYAAPSSNTGDLSLNLTSYGKQLQQLIKQGGFYLGVLNGDTYGS